MSAVLNRPVRIQRSRIKGWRMPDGVIYVGRPGFFGNPFPVSVYGAQRSVDLFRRWLSGDMSMDELDQLSTCVEGSVVLLARAMRERLPTLRGRNLACWCAPGKPCHADVLLEAANADA